MIDAAEAFERLREGNQRFVARAQGHDLVSEAQQSLELPQTQSPFAIILGCSDARVPAEIVFDQGPGDLFVIRVAGNIVAPSQLGSVEFAASNFGTRLVVVLGHSQCGAVQATLEALRERSNAGSRNLLSIVNFIRPAVEPLLDSNPGHDDGALLEEAVRANVRASVQQMRSNSAVIERLVAESGLQIVGAEYSIRTGKVDFFDPVD